MLSGVAYHATYAFIPDVGPWFPVQAVSTASGFSTLAGMVHAVRMPVFFALSGFFAALLLAKRPQTFLKDRARRLLVPFIVGVPLSMAADVLIRRASLAQGTMHPAFVDQGEWLLRPLHLWFLELLFLFCAAAVVLRRLKWSVPLPRVPEVSLLWALVTFGAASLLGPAEPARSLVPSLASVLAYAPFFAFGWSVFGADATALRTRAVPYLALALLLCGFVFTQPLQWTTTGHALEALAAWLMVLGVMGWGVSAPSASKPGFVVESAYWVYLVHHPLVQLGQVLVARQSWPAFVSYSVVVAATLALSFGTFLLVRRTPLGPWLGASRTR